MILLEDLGGLDPRSNVHGGLNYPTLDPKIEL